MGEITPCNLPGNVPRHEAVFEAVRAEVDLSAPVERSAEDGADDAWVDEQEYSHSTRVIELFGELAVRGALDTHEGIVAKETLRERFESSIIEMLHTDKEFREWLEINRERRHLVRHNRIMALDGKTEIAGLVQRGYKKAQEDALADVRMQPVAERCGADVRVVGRVERLPINGMLLGCSMDLKEAMEQYGEKFYDDLGNRKDLAFFQWYYRIDETTLLAATYAVDHTDIDIMREVWAEFGGNIPAGTPTSVWLDHDITRKCTLEEARALVVQIRDRFYEKRGVTKRRFSVDEFMNMNQAVCDEMFDSLYTKLGEASKTRQLGEALHAFVGGLLQGRQYLNPRIYRQLQDMEARGTLHRSDVALLEQLVRYAVTERLREGLVMLKNGKHPVLQQFGVAVGVAPDAYLANRLAGNVIAGAQARRTYGGCTRSIDVSNDPDGPRDRPQDAFGGRDEGGLESGACEYSHNGCYCCPYDDDGNLLSQPQIVTARRNSKGFAKCLRPACGAELAPDGSVISKGRVFAKAQAKRMAGSTLMPFAVEGRADKMAQARQRRYEEREGKTVENSSELAVAGH